MATQPKVRTIEDLEKKYNFAKVLGLTKNVEKTSLSLLKIENELNSILTALVINLSDVLDSQSEISLWFYSGIPTTSNEPYTIWTTPADHIGDIYYDKSSGFVYQWNGVWEINSNPDLVEAMALTNAATDTTEDHERKVFFNDTPTIPYSSGDWWIKEDGSLSVCQISKSSGTYETADFIDSSNYVESFAEKIGEELTVLKGTVTMISDNYAKFTDLATGGSTTIAGENISTGSIQSNNYVNNVSGMKIALSNGTIDSKNFKTDTEGNVYLGDGAKVIGGDGLLSNFQYKTGDDFKNCGFSYWYTQSKYVNNNLNISVYIPEGFTITEAKLSLEHMPQLMEYNGTEAWCYCRNLKLYKVDLTNIKWQGSLSSEFYMDESSKMTEIVGALGTNGYTPPTPSNSDYSTKAIVSTDIKNYLATGMNNLALKCDYTITEEATDIGGEDFIAYKYTGRVLAVLNIIGYMSYGEEEN